MADDNPTRSAHGFGTSGMPITFAAARMLTTPRACFSLQKQGTLDLLGYCPAERTLRLAFGAAAAFGAGHGFMKP
jgi:hypothetical protein